MSFFGKKDKKEPKKTRPRPIRVTSSQKAFRETEDTSNQSARLQYLERKLKFNEKFKYVTFKINSAKNVDEIIIKFKKDIMGLFDAERITIYAVEPQSEQLYSKFLDGGEVMRIQVRISTSSIAGYVASSMQSINIKDVYNKEELGTIHPELEFDSHWDQQSGYRTKSILAAPIQFDGQLYGVIQLINKTENNLFSKEDEENLVEITKALGIAFRNHTKMVQTRYSYLVAQQILTEHELNVAVATARKSGNPLEQILIRKYKVPKTALGTALSQFYSCPFFSYTPELDIPKVLVSGLNVTYLRKALWVPVGIQDGQVIIAIDNPKDQKVYEISNFMQGRKLVFHVALKSDIKRVLDRIEGKPVELIQINDELQPKDTIDFDHAAIDAIVKEIEQGDDYKEAADEPTDAAGIVELANQIIIDAYQKGVSDIHVEPDKKDKKLNIRFRIDGTCIPYLQLPYHYAMPVVSRIKIMSNLDIAEKRLPQDGKIQFKETNNPIELRVATLPTVHGEGVVMRILAASKPMELKELNLSKRNIDGLKDIIVKPYGIVLVVGPTGSGKTTTLHSALGHINTPDRKIWTAEDPVEITQKGLCQVQMHPKINLNFARAMRAFLRADPDVIMVGEMRDFETAAMGIEASLTGHLVFSTLHTNSAAETITRLIDLGLDPFNFADAMLGILAQRLVRTLCKNCKKPYNPTEQEFMELVKAYGEEHFHELGITYDASLILQEPDGCDRCNQTGYRGRTGLHELLLATDEVKSLIQQKAPMEEIRAQAIKDGMRLLIQDGVAKVFQGDTDLAQVRRVCF